MVSLKLGKNVERHISIVKTFHVMYCNKAAVVKVDSMKSHHRNKYLEEFKYTNEGSQQCNMLSGSDDEGFFEV